MDVEEVISRLGEIFDADEVAIAERLLRGYSGEVPDPQLIEEVGLAVAAHRQSKRR